MEFLHQLQILFTNEILIVPAFAWLSAQLLKLIITAVVNKKFTFERLVGDGGMPSGHSATVTSLALMCGMSSQAGFGSVEFAIATILAIIVMHDALGVRREAGKHAVSIIQIADLFNQYFAEKDETIKTDKFKTLVGHTPLQVLCGSLLGIIVVVVYYVFKGAFGLPF